jgi:hypothetical protein
MKKRIDGCIGVYERIKAARTEIGLKSFVEVPTSQAKVEQMPICFMNYGIDDIIKRSSRTVTPTRKGEENTRSLEIIFQIVAPKGTTIGIFRKLRKEIFKDIYPLLKEDLTIDTSVYIFEERSEGPYGYGIPDVEFFVFVVKLVYPDEI